MTGPLEPASAAPPHWGDGSAHALTRRLAQRHTRSRALGGRRGYVLRRLLALSDLIAIVIAYVLMLGIYALAGRGPFAPLDWEQFVVLLPLWTFLATLFKLYHVGDRTIDYSTADEVGPVFTVATIWGWAFLLARAGTNGSSPIELFPSIVLWITTIWTVLGLRALVLRSARMARWYAQRVLVIGSGPDIARVIRRIRRHPEYALEVAGTVDPNQWNGNGRRGRFGANGEKGRELEVSVRDASDLAAFAEQSEISRVIVATAPSSLRARSELIRDLVELGLQVDIISGDPDLCSSNAAVLHYVEGLPVLSIPSFAVARSRKAIKRSFDVLVGGLALVFLSPLFAACALGVMLSSPGPVLFRQVRVGLRGRDFALFKFRTMVEGADQRKGELASLNMHRAADSDEKMFKVRRDPRVTRFGAFLRRWSLDELPQLWNVLRGEMSLVGPRPLIPEEAELVEGRYEVRLEMRPGITGPWQALGRSHIPLEDMVHLDYTYVMNWTFAADLKLLARTGSAIIHARGAY